MDTLSNKSNPYFSKFASGVNWTLWGGITYEILRMSNIFVLLYFLPSDIYGLMGSLFALIYFITKVIDLGATPSIPPFYTLCTRNKKIFKRALCFYLLLPLFCTSLLFLIIAPSLFPQIIRAHNLILLFILPLIIILETIRSFLRLFLHTSFKNKIAVLIEISTCLFYTLALWIPVYITLTPPTLLRIFIPFACDSIITVTLFILVSYKLYKTLPQSTQDNNQEHLPTLRILHSRFVNYLLKIGRDLFTTNVLTPVFAIKFGLAYAGIFYFASTIITSLHAIIKGVITYAGNALLANVKDSSYLNNRETFNLFSQKILSIIIPIITFIICAYPLLAAHTLYMSRPIPVALTLTLLFLLISLFEFFSLLYEQFFIVQEAPVLFIIGKLIEAGLFYLLVISSDTVTPITSLITIILIKIISVFVIGAIAKYKWGVLPQLKPSRCSLILTIIVSIILLLGSIAFSYTYNYTNNLTSSVATLAP